MDHSLDTSFMHKNEGDKRENIDKSLLILNIINKKYYSY